MRGKKFIPRPLPPFLRGETEFSKAESSNQWCTELPVVSGLNTFVTDMNGDYFPPNGLPLKRSVFTPDGSTNGLNTHVSCVNIRKLEWVEQYLTNSKTKYHGCRYAAWADPVETWSYLCIGYTSANNGYLYILHGSAPTTQVMTSGMTNGNYYRHVVTFDNIGTMTATTYTVKGALVSKASAAYNPALMPDKTFAIMGTHEIRPRYSVDGYTVAYATNYPILWFAITDSSSIEHKWIFDSGAGAYVRKYVDQDLYYKIDGTIAANWSTTNTMTNDANATGYSVAGGTEKIVYYNGSTSALITAPIGLISPLAYGETTKSTLKSGTVAPGTKETLQYLGKTQYPLLLSADKLSFSFPDCNEMYDTYKNYADGKFFDSDRVPNVVTFNNLQEISDDDRKLFYKQNNPFLTAFDSQRTQLTVPALSVVKNGLNIRETITNDITVIYHTDGYLYIRKTYDSTRDLLQCLDAYSAVVIGNNNPMNYMYTYLILKTNDNSAGLLTNAVTVHTCGDDNCPLNYNAGYDGANHGHPNMVVLTSNLHGKDVHDVGSSWIDGAGKTFYIIRVVDANTLWLISQNVATDGTWTMLGTITTGLTHVLNAQHTGAISITSQAVGQMEPAIKTQIKAIYLNGLTAITSQGIYTGKYIDIYESYDITDPYDCLANIIASIPVGGYAEQPALNNGQSEITVLNMYRFDKYGARIKTKYTINKYIKSGYFGSIQAARLNKGTYGHIYYYIPDVVAKNDTTPTSWDYANIEVTDTNPASQLDFVAADWVSASVVPYRFIQMLGSDPQITDIGFAAGYHFKKADSGNEKRLAQTTIAFTMPSTGKIYPKFLTSLYGTYIGLTWFESDTYRLYFHPKQHSANATCSYMYDAGDGIYLYFDYHQNVVNDELVIGSEYDGMTVTTVTKHANTTIDTITVTNGKIIVDVVNNYGYGVLKLT